MPINHKTITNHLLSQDIPNDKNLCKKQSIFKENTSNPNCIARIRRRNGRKKPLINQTNETKVCTINSMYLALVFLYRFLNFHSNAKMRRIYKRSLTIIQLSVSDSK